MSSGQAAPGDAPLLPGAARPSPFVALAILVLSLVAGLELVATTAAIRAAVAWSPRLAGTVTVAVSGGGLESAEAAAARATEILARTPGVARISLLDPDPGDAVAGRLMGLSGADDDPPRLLATTTFAGGVSAVALTQDLRRENVAAAVDDHDPWTGPLERTALVTAAGAAGLFLVLIALMWVLAAATAGGGVRREAARASLLLHLGATDGMLLAPFRAGVVGAATLGSLIGAGAAAATAAAAIWSPAAADWMNAEITARVGAPIGVGLDPWDLAAAAVWPPVAILVASWAAGGAAKSRLRALA